jgi:hypothetical protein
MEDNRSASAGAVFYSLVLRIRLSLHGRAFHQEDLLGRQQSLDRAELALCTSPITSLPAPTRTGLRVMLRGESVGVKEDFEGSCKAQPP